MWLVESHDLINALFDAWITLRQHCCVALSAVHTHTHTVCVCRVQQTSCTVLHADYFFDSTLHWLSERSVVYCMIPSFILFNYFIHNKHMTNYHIRTLDQDGV